jgi:hypothetical protein
MEDIMDTIVKAGLLTLLVALAPIRGATADSTDEQSDMAFLQADAVLLEELENERGREGVDFTALNNMNVRATLSGNDVNNSVTGFNVINSGAFSDSSGFNSVIQNSGNNVVIQDATIVNVTIMP